MSTELPPSGPTPPRQPGPRMAHTRVTWLTLRALRTLGHGVRLALQSVLALIIVFEEWGWRPLAAGLAQLARLTPIAWLEAQVQRLPPYAALLVFATPSLLLLPLKLLALYLIASGQEVAAAALFVAAKVVGTAIVARLFQLTQPQLMQIGWFARGYGIVMPWKEALTAWVRESWAWRYGRVVKERIRRVTRPLIAALRSEAALLFARVRGWLSRT